MSLETQISALVAAANDLTGTINNKIQSIDDALDSGLADIENKISAGFSGESRHCSPVGSDTTGDGTALKPYRTIAKAVGSMYQNGTVYLSPGDYFWTKTIHATRRMITIKSTTNNFNDVRIYTSKTENGVSSTGAFFGGVSSSLEFYCVTLLTEGQDQNLSPWQRSLIWSQAGFNSLKIGESGINAAKIVIDQPGETIGHVSRSFMSVVFSYCDSIVLNNAVGGETLDDLFYPESGSTLINGLTACPLTNIGPFGYSTLGGTQVAKV